MLEVRLSFAFKWQRVSVSDRMIEILPSGGTPSITFLLLLYESSETIPAELADHLKQNGPEHHATGPLFTVNSRSAPAYPQDP
jgi:hypothetical protein